MDESNTGVEAVRRAREAISREHDNDPKRLVEYYVALQERHKDRLTRSPIEPTAQSTRTPKADQYSSAPSARSSAASRKP